jgi:hypothetical protein
VASALPIDQQQRLLAFAGGDVGQAVAAYR